MARAPAEVVYCKLSGVLRWSRGTTILKRGAKYKIGDPLVVERPDVFQDTDPGAEPRVSSAGAGAVERRCWQCGGGYLPVQTAQRYCGPECRRRRERTLKRTADRAVSGARSDPPHPPESATVPVAQAYVTEVSARLSAMEALSIHLAGRHPADYKRAAPDREVDLALSAPAGFQAVVNGQVRRLDALRDEARRFVERVTRNRREYVEIEGTVTRVNAAAAEQARLRELWAAELAAMGVDDGDV